MSRLSIRAVAMFSDPGARPAQEDSVLLTQDKGIFSVADGFGGPSAGATAAKDACTAIRDFLTKEAGDREATLPFVLRSYYSLAGNVLFNALIHANRKLQTSNRGKGVHERGGASAVAAYLDGELLALASVGGCEAWLIRAGEAQALTSPKTYSRLMAPTGGAERADGSPLMALGICDDLEPEIAEYRLAPGDWLILATDGIGSGEIHRLADLHRRSGATSDAESLARAVTSQLDHSGYRDNASIGVVIF